ncbi:hypothetical protein JCGZ_05595 [Jatropha curcas]|uniref:Uncharacterized protein n=1 Tax=Jatropha curcas TaxID=180498 RepID=A0A067LA78_JATCU|nr:hypothetical protein JCGZ_05595 [Jatropha curcas]
MAEDGEMQISDSNRKTGGWITFPFIAGTLAGLTIAIAGSMSNLVVYLIEKFNVKSIEATQIFNIVNGCSSLLPVIAGIIADSFLGCFSVIWGIFLLSLTAILHTLRPQPCGNGSSSCTTPTTLQFAVLYSGIALTTIGQGGSRFAIATMGANQFDNVKDQGFFMNWFVVILYASGVTGATVIVYIQDNVSWGLGFGLSVGANMVGLAFFLWGNRYYCHIKLEGSPFTSLFRVIIAAVRKRKVQLSSRMEDYYFGHNQAMETEVSEPTKSFRFLNKAAQKTEGDIKLNGSTSTANPWRLCSVQQVEDLKSVMRIFPVLSSGIFLSTPIGVLNSLTILQALSMDRHIGSSFKFPAGSVIVFVLTSAAISLALIDRFVYPVWQKLTHRSPTPLQRIGAGHVLNVIGMAVAALVESKRRKVAVTHNLNGVVPISVLWLVPQLAVVGIGEAFHYPGQVTLYYRESPKSVGSTATAMSALNMGIAYYLSSAVVDLVQKTTSWLPDNINNGRLDYVYWMLFVLGSLNFAYFLICAKFYKYQNVE